jgi:polar amino acid transport system permease protein
MDLGILADNLPYMLRGFRITCLLAAASIVGSTITGTVFAALRLSPWSWLRSVMAVYIDVVRSIPLLMFIFWVFFLLPIVIGHALPALVAALIALTAYNTGYMAEVIRAGIQSVPRTQAEAGRSTGLSHVQTMTRIVLPQAFMNMLPAIISRLIALLMASSLVYIVGVTDFFRAAHNVNSRVFAPYTIFLFVGIVYFCSCYSLSLLGRYIHTRLAPQERISRRISTSE